METVAFKWSKKNWKDLEEQRDPPRWVSQALRGSEGGSNSGWRAPCLTAIESASYKLGYPQNVVKQYSVLEHAEIAFMQGMPGCGTD